MLENSGGTDGGNLTVRVGDGLYVWGLLRGRSGIDLNGTIETASAPAAAVEDEASVVSRASGATSARWLAPSAAAKTFLDPGIVASPDGKRIYAIGVTGSSDPGPGGSTGIYVFDATTLEVLGHWQPTADFTSLAVSADGQFVYAAAPGGSSGRSGFAQRSLGHGLRHQRRERPAHRRQARGHRDRPVADGADPALKVAPACSGGDRA